MIIAWTGLIQFFTNQNWAWLRSGVNLNIAQEWRKKITGKGEEVKLVFQSRDQMIFP